MNDKLSGIKPGDRVRVTFEASVIDAGGVSEHPIKFRPDGASMDSLPGASILNQPTFHIERIEKPLEVGDKVVPAMPSHCYGELIAISGTKAWVFWEHNRSHATLDLSDIVRRPEYR